MKTAIRKQDVDAAILSLLALSEWVEMGERTDAEKKAIELLTDAGFLEWSYIGTSPIADGRTARVAFTLTGPQIDERLAAEDPGFTVECRRFRRSESGRAAADFASRDAAAVIRGIRKADIIDAERQVRGVDVLEVHELPNEPGEPLTADNHWGSVAGEPLLETAYRLWVGIDETWQALDDQPERVYRALDRLVECGLMVWKFSGTVENEDTGESKRVAFEVTGFKPQHNGIRVAYGAARFPTTAHRKFSQDLESHCKLTERGAALRRLWSSDERFDELADAYLELWCEPFASREVTAPPAGEVRATATPPEGSEIEQPKRPRWDTERSTLTFGEDSRTYARRAKNPVIVLTAFEEDGWPFRIDTPLHPDADLREVVRTLNTGLCGMRFRLDGSGQGICWQPTKTPTELPR